MHLLHELVNKTTVKQGDTSTVYVVTNPRNVSLEGSNSGTINSGSLTIGTDCALGVDFISQNLTTSSYKAILNEQSRQYNKFINNND